MRGKKSAAAGNRRAEAATQKAQDLDRALNEERQAHRAQVDQLNAEITRLRSSIARSARELSAAQIREVQEAADTQLHREREEHRERSLEALTTIDKNPEFSQVSPLALDAIAELLGVREHWGSGINGNRQTRRIGVISSGVLRGLAAARTTAEAHEAKKRHYDAMVEKSQAREIQGIADL